MGNKQKLERFHLDTWDFLGCLSLLLYASGSYIPESKISRVAITDSQKSFPNFMPLVFDGRFFGPISSEVEKASSLGNQVGYFTEANYTRDYEPIHLSRKLTENGERFAETLAEQSENFGLEKFDKFVARQLAISSMPVELAVAMGIYYARSKLQEIQIDLKDSLSQPYSVYCKTTKNTIEQVFKKVKDRDLVISDSMSIQSSNDEKEHVISYSINKDKIRDRYGYLTIDPAILKSEIAFFDKNDGNESKKIILEGCCNELDDKNKEFRKERISRLLEKYPRVLSYYMDEMRSNLKLLDENLNEIQKGYDHIFEVQEAIAETSGRHKVKTVIRIGENYTSSELRVDDELKEKIKPMIEGQHVWHSGLDLYIQHIPQFLDRIFLTEHKYDEEKLHRTLLTR